MLAQCFVVQSNSFISMSRTAAICLRVGKSGCELLVHHLETVAGFFPNSLANQLFVLLFSARTTLSLFISSILQSIALNAKLIIFDLITMKIENYCVMSDEITIECHFSRSFCPAKGVITSLFQPDC
jgi:hypothetical protein